MEIPLPETKEEFIKTLKAMSQMGYQITPESYASIVFRLKEVSLELKEAKKELERRT